MKAHVFFIMTLLLPCVNAKASNSKRAPPKDDKPDSGETQPAETHTQASKAKPTTGKGQAATERSAHTDTSDQLARFDHYVHHWTEFPLVKGLSLSRQEPVQIRPSRGRVTVIVFLASWCVPCQQQIRDFRQIEDKFSDRYTDFVYIFAHDTESDARGFSTVYKLGNNALLASAPVLESFHQPELPSYYVADRFNWLILRRLSTQKSDITDLERFLELHTAF